MDALVPPLTAATDDTPARVLATQRAAAQREGVLGLTQRLSELLALDRMIHDHREAFAEAIAADFGGRARAETMLAEVVPLQSAIRHARHRLARWMRPERRQVSISGRPGQAWVMWQPLGCVGIIAPWNYPLLLTLGPLVDALAAGNRVILKPSELTPRFSALLDQVVGQYFEPEVVSVVLGGAETARALCALPLDHLVFTGSAAVGRQVMRAAAQNLVPVTLELGGKSPVIVAPDYPVAKAARTVATAKFFSAGQTCIAPDYALVPRDQVEAFAEAVMARARRMYPRVAGNGDYTAIISERHYARLVGLRDEAAAAGAVVRQMEDAPGERRLGPSVVTDAPLEGGLMTQEIFGPILPVIGYDDIADAIAFVNARERPLALYPFSRSKAVQRAMLEQTVSGGMAINSALMQCIQEDLPFGGVGPSGMGAYHGRDGFRRLSHARAVYQAGWVSSLDWLAPPYGARMRVALGFMLRR